MQGKIKLRLRRWVLALLLPVGIVTFTGCDQLRPTTDAEHIARAKDYEDKGEHRSSIVELKAALQKNPDNPEARRLLGEINVKLGHGADAEKELRRALELGVVKEGLLIPLAESLLQQGKFQNVLDEIVILLSLDPKDQAKLTAYRGNAWFGLNKIEQAKAEYEQALVLDSQSEVAKFGLARLASLNNEPEQALALIQEILNTDPNHVKAWLFQADLQHSKGDLEQARISYEKVLNLDGGHAEARAQHALVLIELGKLDEAHQEIQALKKNAPSYFLTPLTEGVFQLAQQKYPQAQVALDEAHHLNDRYALTYYYLGAAHLMQNHFEQAEQYLSRFQSAFQNSAQVRRMLALAKFRRGDAQGAKTLLKPVVDSLPNDSFSLNLLGNIEIALGNKDQGLQYLKRVAELHPESAEAKIQLGSLLLASGQKELGITHLSQAAAMDEKLWQPQLTMVMAHIQANEYDQALALLGELEGKMSGSTTPRNLLGLIHARKGDLAKAKEIWSEILAAEPGDLSASTNLAELALSEKRLDEAKALYEDALREHPKHLPTQLKLAELEGMQGNIKDMERRLNDLIKEHPEALQPRLLLANHYVRYGQAKQAQTLLEEARARFPQNRELLSSLIEAQLEDDQAVRALETAQTLLKLAPTSAKAHYLVARAHWANHDAKAMRTALERSLQIDPKFLLSRIAMVRLLTLEKKAAEAKQLLEQLTKEYPDDLETLSLRGWFATQQNHPNEAIQAYRTALAKYPSTTFVTSLAKAQWAAGDTAQSLKTLEDWNQAHPHDIWVLYLRSGLYGALGMTQEARKTLETLLEQNDKNVTALNDLAWLIRREEPAKALAYAEKAYELAPRAPQIVDTLAMVLLENQRPDRALLLSRQALDLQPNNPALRYHWAVAQEKNGHTAEAVQELENLLAQAKNFPERQEAQALLNHLNKPTQ